jgi:hypothetical protein
MEELSVVSEMPRKKTRGIKEFYPQKHSQATNFFWQSILKAYIYFAPPFQPIFLPSRICTITKAA